MAARAPLRLFCFACFATGLACSPAGTDLDDPQQSAGGPSSGSNGGSGGSGASAGTAPLAGAATAGSAEQAASGGPNGGSTTTGGGGSGAGGSAPDSPCGSGSIFCSDFEAETIPTQLLFYPEYLRATQSFITLDTTVVHAGKRALKVTGSDYSQMLGVTVPSKFWGRVYLRSDTDIQPGHNTYVAAGTGSGDPNDGKYIRIGEHQCQLELNRNTDDKELLSNGGQYMCQGGVKLLKDTWYCLEFYYDGPGQETRVLVDGAEVSALHTTDWGSHDYKIFKLGFEKYHGAAKTIWYDDLALAAQQLHCL